MNIAKLLLQFVHYIISNERYSPSIVCYGIYLDIEIGHSFRYWKHLRNVCDETNTQTAPGKCANECLVFR